jgi:hypothetical protein
MNTRLFPLARFIVAMAITTTAFATPHQLLAQQDGVTAPKAAGDEEAVKARAKPRGRLPVYYSRVISQDQRETIYGLQAKFQAEIDKLMEQLRKLEADRDLEVRKVLSEEQKQRVDAFVAEAKAKRESRQKKTSTDTAATPSVE